MTRVYLPTTLAHLGAYVQAGEIGPAPLTAYAVTAALREAWRDGSEEEWEYAALQESATASLGLQEHDLAQRVVLALDVAAADEDPDATTVTLPDPVPWRLVAAVHADTEGLSPDEWGGGELPDLAWFGTQEVSTLIGRG